MGGEHHYKTSQHWIVKAWERFFLLILAAVFALNCGLILAVQVLLIYDIPAPVTDETVLRMEAGAEILDHRNAAPLQSWLLKTQSGETKLVTLEKHPFLEDYRVVRKGTLTIGAADFEDNIGTDSARLMLAVTDGEIARYDVTGSGIRIRGFSIPLVFVLWNVLLIALEIIACWLIGKLKK